MKKIECCAGCSDVSQSYDGKAVCSRTLVSVDRWYRESGRPADCPRGKYYPEQEMKVLESSTTSVVQSYS